MFRMLKLVILLNLIPFLVYASPTELRIHSGEISVKGVFDTYWHNVTMRSMVENGDTLFVPNEKEASAFLNNTLFVHCKNAAKFIFQRNSDKIILTLLNGQLFFAHSSGEDNLTLTISIDECSIAPKGTSAAVKSVPDIGHSTAVLEGIVEVTTPKGEVQQITAGQYCSYNKKIQKLGAVNKLSPEVITSLQSLSPKEDQKDPLSSSSTQESVSTKVQSSSTVTPTQPVSDNAKESINETKEAETIATSDDESTEGKSESSESESDESKDTSPQVTSTSSQTSEEQKRDTPDKPKPMLSAGVVSVGEELWTRIAFSIDIPIWRFGICFDLEIYLDKQGNFTNKGWNFDSPRDASETLLQKIRYIRFNYPDDPVFGKFGGLDNVTLGMGFLVDRFTNMLNYPGEKLYGLQFDLNNLSPIGITLQTLFPDFMDFADDGGIIAGRLALIPLKASSAPIINGISIGAQYATDLNQYAPARRWDYSLKGTRWDRDEDNITDSTYLFEVYGMTSVYDSIVAHHKYVLNDYDTEVRHQDQWAQDSINPVHEIGADLIIPLVQSDFLNLDLYGQIGALLDDEDADNTFKGWGFGAPGIGLKVGPFWARMEYRHLRDKFLPGYFNTYYLKERIVRKPVIMVKEETLVDLVRNGIFALCGFNILSAIILEGSGQAIFSEKDSSGNREVDQSLEASLAIGSMLIERIPKLTQLKLFYNQTNIENNFFKKSLTTYWGYTIGAEVVSGASIIWKTTYGWIPDENGEWVDDKTFTITAGLAF